MDECSVVIVHNFHKLSTKEMNTCLARDHVVLASLLVGEPWAVLGI